MTDLQEGLMLRFHAMIWVLVALAIAASVLQVSSFSTTRTMHLFSMQRAPDAGN
jgi:hypothetical protein